MFNLKVSKQTSSTRVVTISSNSHNKAFVQNRVKVRKLMVRKNQWLFICLKLAIYSS